MGKGDCVEETVINVTVVRTDRKSLKMTVQSDATVIVEAPKALTEEKITEIINSKKSWIISKVEQRLSGGNCYNKPKGIPGEHFSYLGRDVTLSIRPSKKGCPPISVKNGTLIVRQEELTPSDLVTVIKKWYYQKTEKEVLFWIRYYQDRFEQAPNRVCIKDQKRRWASCSSANNLNFNWRLSMLPTWVISYVVLHEMCHFEEMNHSKAFWDLVNKHMPEYEKAKCWLKENGYRFLPE